MRYAFAILTLLALTGCSDSVTTRFATLEDAKVQRAFERAWLPPVLPDSAKSIIESNNLDLNTGKGSFQYDFSERASYLERLKQSGAVYRAGQHADILTLTTNGSRWEIELTRSAGRAQWKTRPL
ncbi:MAG TPA: hypothetical protein VEC99_13925 [Clostridia bacterium]|nr:hypothetical protein [Clostridia bacterium]